DTVKFSPQPSTGGSWSWNGGCGAVGTAREQTVSGGNCSATTTYTNSCGAISSQTFVLSVSEQPPTPTPAPTCTPTAITPYLQVNGGSLLQTSGVIYHPGDTVKFSPQPSSGGSWSWNGGCGTSGTSREQTVSPPNACSATTVYTNSCGAQSSMTYNLGADDAHPPTPAPTPAPTSCPQYVSGHAYATG